MAAARLSSAISSTFLISRASSITCWPSSILRPAFSSSNIMGGSTMSMPTGCLATPASRRMPGDLLGVALHEARGRRHRAAQADQARLAVLLEQPGRVEPVVHGGRAEVPHDRLLARARAARSGELVALPFADLGGGDVADVVDVEQQQRAQLGVLQRLLGAADAVAAQAVEIDAALEVHAHGAPGRQRAVPVASAGRDLRASPARSRLSAP